MSNVLGIIKSNIIVILTAMLPVVELRGAIPVGIALGIPPIEATILSIIGSTLPVPFILFFIKYIFKWLSKFEKTNKLIEKITSKAMKKSDSIAKYEFWGLLLFVGIPLPGTGAWTGSLIASLLGMKNKVAIPAIFLGNVLAGTIVYLLSYTTINIFNLF